MTDLFWQAFSGKLGFVLDGIFVAEGARGLGVGTALLEAGHEQAQTLGLSRVELDVIDANPKAQALYERMGYVVTKQEDLGPLRHLFGFNTAYRMAKVP
ncbi:GNAT family N-acetyltransferase [Falsiruegeria litorea]|uniref:GNAT family N-acetyltransferase n=1 Tax=Falsiruegeria litorea TaxID=1280831 RepID=UPI001F3DEE45|nr:GNAT family N-acetyltransferase [Falsiruegeria litorea]